MFAGSECILDCEHEVQERSLYLSFHSDAIK